MINDTFGYESFRDNPMNLLCHVLKNMIAISLMILTFSVQAEVVVEGVVSPATEEIVVENPVIESVIPPDEEDVVVERPVVERVVSPAAEEIMVGRPVVERVVSPAAEEIVVERPIVERVVSPAVEEIVVEKPVVERVILPSAPVAMPVVKGCNSIPRKVTKNCPIICTINQMCMYNSCASEAYFCANKPGKDK